MVVVQKLLNHGSSSISGSQILKPKLVVKSIPKLSMKSEIALSSKQQNVTGLNSQRCFSSVKDMVTLLLTICKMVTIVEEENDKDIQKEVEVQFYDESDVTYADKGKYHNATKFECYVRRR